MVDVKVLSLAARRTAWPVSKLVVGVWTAFGAPYVRSISGFTIAAAMMIKSW